MEKQKQVILILLIILMTSACQGSTTLPTATPTTNKNTEDIPQFVSPVSVIEPTATQTAETIKPTPTKQAKLISSMAGLKGQVVSASDNQPVSSTLVRLATVFWDEKHQEGAFVLDESASPGIVTDAKGEFLFVNIKPADYVIMIGETPTDKGVITNDDGSAKIYSVDAGEILDIGTVTTELY